MIATFDRLELSISRRRRRTNDRPTERNAPPVEWKFGCGTAWRMGQRAHTHTDTQKRCDAMVRFMANSWRQHTVAQLYGRYYSAERRAMQSYQTDFNLHINASLCAKVLETDVSHSRCVLCALWSTSNIPTICQLNSFECRELIHRQAS